MTNLATQLAQIQLMGAGVYQLVDDTNTQLPPIASNARLRFIPINMKRGPINSIVYFEQRDFQGFKDVFGDITRKDERQGNFSVRTCLQALENGPIVVMNLRKFEADTDKTEFQGLTTMLTTQLVDQNDSKANEIEFSKMFTTDRLWTPKPEALLNVTDSNLFMIANIGSKNLSVFARRSQNAGYRQTIANYYSNQNRPVPEYLNPQDLMIDTMVEIFVFNTDFSDPVKNQASETYGQFFDANGLVQEYVTNTGNFDALQLLTTITEAGFVQRFEGSLIPGSLDANKNPFYIEELVNASALVTGLMLKVNDIAYENYSDFEPEFDANDEPVYENNASKRPYPIDLVGQNLFDIDGTGSVDETKLTPTIKTLSYDGYTLTKGEIKRNTGQELSYDLSEFNSDVLKVPVYTDATVFTADQSTLILPDMIPVNIGDKYIAVNGNLCTVFDIKNYGSVKTLKGLGTPGLAIQADGTEFPKNPQGLYIYPAGSSKAGDLVTFGTNGLPEDADTSDEIPVPTLTEAQFETLYTKYGALINFLKVRFDGFVENGYNTPATETIEVVKSDDNTEVELKESRAFLLRSATNKASLKSFKLKPYKARPSQFTNGTNENQKDVLSVLGIPGIVAGLKAIQESGVMKFRYIVDAFKTYIEPNAKSELATLAHQTNSRAIANMPFMKDFSDSKNPYFRNTPQSDLDLSFIPKGGNRNIASNNTFSLPKDYADKIWFFGPGLKANHYGTTVIVPPAGAVSKAFVNKFIAGQPYDTVANTTGLFAVDSVADVEYPLTKEETGPLEKFGYNPIVNDSRLGLKIYGDFTAKNDVITDLSKIHISELVLTIQEEFEAILRSYPFKANNLGNRLKLKTEADRIMQRIQDNGGVVWYLNICDESNNTQDIINRDLGIIETHIQATKNGEKWVHVLTLHNNLPSFEIR
ncbi:gp90 [Sphingomonas phage PAU]|uniref:tail sheath n=1 Tax=Sphingomonas phage PAU TaxID=1150991 RepID=UPI00025731E4|nr:tail sheath [Sphingomonas phage PAU]AFF28088.1 gp90 [Sphingomonas phage PAU]